MTYPPSRRVRNALRLSLRALMSVPPRAAARQVPPARTLPDPRDTVSRMVKGRHRRLELPAGTPTFTAAAAVATDARAPTDERLDAEVTAAREAARYATQIDMTTMLTFAQRMAKADEADRERERSRIKPLSEGLSPGMARVALTLSPEEQRAVFLHRPIGLDFPRLRHIVRSDVVLRAIIMTRISQVTRFLSPSQDEWRPGFRFRYLDPNRSVGDGDTDRFWWLTRWLTNCGAEFDPRRRRMLKRDHLVDFTTKHLQDSLALDAAPIELVPTASGRLHGFVPVDGGRIYLTDPVYGLDGGEERPEIALRHNLHLPDPEEVTAVLVREGRIQAWYSHEDLLYPVRRPTSDHMWMGYGQPEPEELIGVVTAFLNAMSLNARGFTHNSIPQGILTLFGDFTEEDVQQLRQEWDAWTGGTSNRWRLPVMVSKDRESGATYVPTGMQFSEMMFARWMTFLVALKTSLYLMDPEEINFDAFTSRNASISGSDTEERITSSKDKGLYPLLTFYQRTLNEMIAGVDDEVEMYWTGLLPDQQSMKQDEQLAATYGEFRVKRGMSEPESEMLRDAPMNPALQGIYLQEIQMQQQAQQPQQPPAQPGMEADADGNRLMTDHAGEQYQVQPGMEDPNAQAQPPAEPPMVEDESVMGKAAALDGHALLWWD
jgi:hypothetical protein